MKMTELQAYKHLEKLSLELIEAQANEDSERYKEINDYLIAINCAKRLISINLLNHGIRVSTKNK